MDPITLRSIERIVAVVIGGVSIYLGYRLFLAMPEYIESEGKFRLPGGISIYMTRIGPGAFFALFGAIVVAISFHQAITYREGFQQPKVYKQGVGQGSQPEQAQSGEPGAGTRSYTGFGAAPVDQQSARLQAAHDIKFLNSTLPQLLRRDLSANNRTDEELLVPRLKLAIVKGVWNSDWGDFGRFQQWVEHGAIQPAPTDLAKPAHLFLQGEL